MNVGRLWPVLLLCGSLAACTHASAVNTAASRVNLSPLRRQRVAALAPDLAAQAAAAEREWARLAAAPDSREYQQIAESLWLAAAAEADRIAAERAYGILDQRRWVAAQGAARSRQLEAELKRHLVERDCGAARFAQVQAAYARLAACAARTPLRSRCAALSSSQQQALLSQVRLLVSLAQLLAPSAQGEQLMARLERFEVQPPARRAFPALVAILADAERCLGESRTTLASSASARLASAAEAAELRGLSAVTETDGLRVTWPDDSGAEPVALYAVGALVRLFPQARSTLIVALPADPTAQTQLRSRARAAQRGLAAYGVQAQLSESPVDAITPGLLWRLTFPLEASGEVDG